MLVNLIFLVKVVVFYLDNEQIKHCYSSNHRVKNRSIYVENYFKIRLIRS